MEHTTNQPAIANHSYMKDLNDQQLWNTAKKRVAFKSSLASYFFVNTLLVAVWFFTSRSNSYFWPVWPMLGWGIGLAFQYVGAYHRPHLFSVENEYEKLKEEYRQ
jgi:hypothetical protein